MGGNNEPRAAFDAVGLAPPGFWQHCFSLTGPFLHSSQLSFIILFSVFAPLSRHVRVSGRMKTWPELYLLLFVVFVVSV